MLMHSTPTEAEERCGPETQGELGALLSGLDSDTLLAQNGHVLAFEIGVGAA